MPGDQDLILDGGCSCGSVRYRIHGPPLFVHCCHCDWCQRESGGAFVINALIETDRLEVTKGKPKHVMTPSNSGYGQKIIRCPQCFVALWSHYAMSVGDKVSFVRVGTLDEPDRLAPDIHIFTESKQPWLELSGDALVVEAYYDRHQYWPADSLKRFEALEE